MRRFFVAASFFAFALALARTSAAAADTGYLAMAEPNPYTGACPVTLHFNGHIDGAFGSSVTYNFGSYAAGSWKYGAAVTTTIPAGGSLPISSTLGVDSSRAGFQSYGLIISSPIGSDSDTHGKIYLTVTCASGGGTSVRGGGVGPNIPIPSAPLNLNRTKDPGECSDHMGSDPIGVLLCKESLAAGDVWLVWDYNKSEKVDAFRIYRYPMGGGARTLVGEQYGDLHAKNTKLKAADIMNTCFVVRAYNGMGMSGDSNHYCTDFIIRSNTAHVDLPLAQSKSSGHRSHELNTSSYCGLSEHGLGFDDPAGQVAVGYVHFWDGGSGPFPCWEKIDFVYRGAIRFDTSPIPAGKKISKAVLNFTMQKTFANDAALATCASELMYGVNDWSGLPDLIPGASYRDLPTGVGVNVSNGSEHISNSTSFQIDVTDAVRGWLDGTRPNYGFVMRGQYEDYPRNNDKCESYYGAFSIGVDYFN